MLCHQTKDILYVQNFLGRRRTTPRCSNIQLAEAIFKETTDKFTVKVAKAPEEIKGLLEVGFEYVCEHEGLMFSRKRK